MTEADALGSCGEHVALQLSRQTGAAAEDVTLLF